MKIKFYEKLMKIHDSGECEFGDCMGLCVCVCVIVMCENEVIKND